MDSTNDKSVSNKFSAKNSAAGSIPPLRVIAGGLRPHHERSQQRAQVRRFTALMNTTAALFAHEVANPLQGISASLELVERDLLKHLVSDTAPRTLLRQVRQEVARLTQLLDEFRSLTVPQRPALERRNLRKIVEEALAIQLIVYRTAGVVVRFDFAESVPAVNLDPAKMKQVILNLCGNALDAMPQGGDLTLRCYSLDETVVLEIADSGRGIPAGLDVFGLFKTTKAGGGGLGLPIVEQIVLDHNGTIDYTSEPGRGTTFRIVLPAAI